MSQIGNLPQMRDENNKYLRHATTGPQLTITIVSYDHFPAGWTYILSTVTKAHLPRTSLELASMVGMICWPRGGASHAALLVFPVGKKGAVSNRISWKKSWYPWDGTPNNQPQIHLI